MYLLSKSRNLTVRSLNQTTYQCCRRHLSSQSTKTQSINQSASQSTPQSTRKSIAQPIHRYQGTSVLSKGAGSYAGLGTGSYADQPHWTPIPRLTRSSIREADQSTSGSFSLLEDDSIVCVSSGWTSNIAVTKHGAAFQWGHSINPSVKQTVLISRLRNKFPKLLSTLQSFELGRLTFTSGLTEPALISGFGLTQAELINRSTDNQPANQSIIASKRAVSSVNGGDFSALLTANGDVYTWGGNFYGQLGHSTHKATVSQPTKIQSFASNNIHIKQMSAGFAHLAMVTSQGELFVTGKHQHGALGLQLPKSSKDQKDSGFKGVLHPRLVLETASTPSTTPLSLDEKSPLFNQSMSQMRLPITPIGPVSKVACGMKHTLVLNEAGAVYSSGTSAMAECGNFDTRDLITMIDGMSDHVIVDIAAGAHHSLFLTSEGRVLACGLNEQGQCGIPHELSVQSPKRTQHRNQASFFCVSSPVELELPVGFRAVAVFAGFYDSALVDATGRCLWMGSDLQQKGFGTPHFDTHLDEYGATRSVAFGLAHALAVVDQQRTPYNQSFNQSVDQSIIETNNQSINQSISSTHINQSSTSDVESEELSSSSALPHSTSTGRPSWY